MTASHNSDSLREPLIARNKVTTTSSSDTNGSHDHDHHPHHHGHDEEAGLGANNNNNDDENNNETFEDETEEQQDVTAWLLGQKYRKSTFVIACLDLLSTLALAWTADRSKAFWDFPTYSFGHSTMDIVWLATARAMFFMYQTTKCKSVLAAKMAGYTALFSSLYGITKMCCATHLFQFLHDSNNVNNDDNSTRALLYALVLMMSTLMCLVECVYENLVASFSSLDLSHTVAPTRNEAAQGLVTGDARSIGLWELLKVLKPYFWPTGLINRICVFLTWFFLILSKVANVVAPLFIAKATDDLANHKTNAAVTWHVVCYGLLLFGNKVLKEAQSMAYIRVKLIAGVQLKEQVFSHILSLSMDWHQRKSTGAVVTAMQRGITASNTVVQYIFLYLFPTACEAVVVAVVFIETFGAPELAAVAIIGCTLYVVVTIELTVWRMQFRKKMNKADNDASHKITEAILNIETVKCFTAEQHEIQRYRESVNMFQDQAYKIQGSLSLLNSSQQLVLNSTLIAALLVAAQGYTRGQFTLGQFVAVNVYVMQLFAPLDFLGTIYGMAIGSYVDLENLCNIMAETPDIADRVGAQSLPSSTTTTSAAATLATRAIVPSQNHAPPSPPLRALDIEFRNISFAYPSRPDVQVLRNVSFKVPAGTTTALVGETGSGKSSLTRLLFRFYEATEGQVLLAGHDVLDLTQRSLRRTLGMVPQDHSLFNDTLRYNIAYGCFADDDDDAAAADGNDDTAMDDAIQKAATAAELDSFVSEWPDGLETMVGERGQQLSGGQKQVRTKWRDCSVHEEPLCTRVTHAFCFVEFQRIAIARVLVKDAPVVVLDEATSSLDSRTEEKIQSALESLGAGRTMIIIAHRLSTIQNADQIIVMSKGQILERGTHEALIAKGTWHERCYASLWDKQKKAD